MTPGPRGLTRRAALGSFAAAGAGVLVGPAAAQAASRGGGRLFDRWLGSVSGLSPVIAPGRPFVLAGVRWSGPASARIELRSRTAGGAWGAWGLASVRGHEPDRGGDARELLGEPLWLGETHELQLRTSGPVEGLRVTFVAPQWPAAGQMTTAAAGQMTTAATGPTASTAAAFPLAQPVLDAGGGQPPIIARTAWAGVGALPAAGPYYGAVEMAFVHHSDNPNGYSAGDVPAMILSIYDYHRYSNGWWDIGYNFVIDAFGRVWEARLGGIDQPVIGAQAGGYNAQSTGVVILGTFNFQSPTQASIDALQRLLAWKLPLHGVPALGKVTVVVDPSAAFYTPFAPGAHVSLPRIAGHRDGDLTDCPGDILYGRLPAVRTAVDSLAGVPVLLTIKASKQTVGPSTPVTLTGALGQTDGAPVPNAPVQIQSIGGLGAVTTIATVTTDAQGMWTTTLTPSATTVLRALRSASPAAASGALTVGLAPVITLTIASSAPLRVSGTVSPAKKTVTVDVYKLSGAHRTLVASRRVSGRSGSYAVTLSLGRGAGGRYEVVAGTAADTQTVAAASPPVKLTV